MTTVTISSVVTIFEVGAVAKFDAATGDRLDCAHIELRPVFEAFDEEEVQPAEYDGDDLVFPAVMAVPPGNACVTNALFFTEGEPRGHIALSVENAVGADFFEPGKRLRVTFEVDE